MKDRIAIMRRRALTRVMLCSLLLWLGCVAGGCDTNRGTGTASSDVPEGVKIMKEQMKNQIKNQMKQQNRGKARPQSGGRPGR
jgi:hypothetical protein